MHSEQEGYWCLSMKQSEPTHFVPSIEERRRTAFLRIRLEPWLLRNIGLRRVGRESISATTRRLIEAGIEAENGGKKRGRT